ncbi:hypothetical protein FACS189413_08790 [Bacteroidia bacterium]|nr:hypothetical protein FACS189413_08790 [Bacteroidia bacterium]
MKMLKEIYRYCRILLIRIISIGYAKPCQIGDSLLILAPHPDDEIFGCAGLIQHCLQQKKRIQVVILTGGENAYDKSLIDKENLTEARRNLTLKAAQIIGLPSENIHFLNWGDGKIHDRLCHSREGGNLLIQEGVPAFARMTTKAGMAVDTIFAPHPFEGWSDHIATAKIASQLVCHFRENGNPVSLYYYCVWLWYSMPTSKIKSLDWKHSFLLSMNKKEYNAKLQAIEAYIQPQTSFGKSFSGELPALFVKANQWKNELYFEEKSCGK